MALVSNPVIPGFYPDPSICRVGEDYYLVNSSFEYFPGVPVFHSTDLAQWKQIGNCLTRPSQLPLDGARPSDGIWAPTIRYHDGLFYMVTTNKSHRGNFIVTTADPHGEWSDPAWFDPEGWDPSLFIDDDGTAYITRNGDDGRGGWGIVQYPIDLKTFKTMEDPQLIFDGTGFGPEAPHMFKRNGWYYLLLAEGGTHIGHYELIARASTPWGPFELCPHNPILTHRDHLLKPFQAIGHADFVEGVDGRWWCVCLGIRNLGSLLHPQHILGRETFIAPLYWDQDGWPVVGENGTIPSKVEIPCTPHPNGFNYRQDFDSTLLPLEWSFLRNPRPGSWSLTERQGWLTLHGNETGLDDIASPAFVGRRQQHHRCMVRARIDFSTLEEAGEAGLTVFMGPGYHYDLSMIRLEGQRCIQLRRRMADLNIISARQPVPNSPLVLEVVASPTDFQFCWGTSDKDLHPLAKAQAKFLATEFTGGFTGLFFGLYAQKATAWVDWFEYRGV